MNENPQLAGVPRRPHRYARCVACQAAQVRSVLLIALAVIAVLTVASQFVIPPVAENRIEGRLTDGGGTASASVAAFPAARLLFGDGDRISVSGNGLDLPLQEGADAFDRLDGFDEVDVSLRDFRAGPFAVRSFELARSGSSASYHLTSSSMATTGDIANFGASQLGLPGGPLLRFFADQALGGNRTVPIDLDMELRSDGGRVVVVSGEGSVAGLPTGPLAELITSAIVVQL
jgi:hypothetical protein